MKNSHKLLLGIAFIPYLAGAGYFQMAEFAKNRATSMEEVSEIVPTTPASVEASSFSDGSIGEIRMFAGNFAPRGWAICNGQTLSINQYQALFSILGTTYGGDGRTSFKLPDFRGRVAVGVGKAEGDTQTKLGQMKGKGIFNLRRTPINSAAEGTEVQVVTANQFRNHQPSLGINFVICLTGTYPSRN